jgi:hypothetical protein
MDPVLLGRSELVPGGYDGSDLFGGRNQLFCQVL